MKEKKYNGWLISNSFWKRSIAVFGYFMCSYIIIILGIVIIAIMFNL